MLRFHLLAVSIGQFADEVHFVPPLCPSLRDLRSD
jgi:hypothetical protein